MKLFLHFGLYKTASSYLQTLCGINRNWLADNGYFFPIGDREDDILAGRISPGNAGKLVQYLRENKRKQTEVLLKKWIAAASERSCHSVVISSEAIVHLLAKDISRRLLHGAAHSSGFSELQFMGFFRDLVDHSLSTYKHRAKNGTLPEYLFWLENSYETPQVLKGLLLARNEGGVVWTFRRYERNSEILATRFFIEWLQIEIPPNKLTHEEVNPSLNLIELEWIRLIRQVSPFAVEGVYNVWVGLGKKEKSSDTNLERYSRNRASQILTKYNDILDSLNAFLPQGEKLCMIHIEESLASNPAPSDEWALSRVQAEALVKALNVPKGWEGLKIKTVKLLRALIKKIKSI